MKTEIIQSENGVNHVINGPLTTPMIREASPELLINEVDERVVRIRPMSTPVDQITRMIGARPAKSMVVDYYSVDCRPTESRVSGEPRLISGQTGNGRKSFLVKTENDRIFSPTDTLLFPECLIATDGEGEEPLVVYVQEVIPGSDGGLRVVSLTQIDDEAIEGELPELMTGQRVVRMGRAAGELDVQTAQFEALPVKARNYCQIFKTQVEQSAYATQSAKEVGWTFSDQEEVAIMDMRMGMEKSFLFGSKLRLPSDGGIDEVMFTGGIWSQASTGFEIDYSKFSSDTLIDLMKTAFTGQAAGSQRKIFLAGSDLISLLNKMESTKVLMANDTVTRWGIDFNEIRSKFGSLYVVHSEVFDQCGRSTDGIIIDPQYMTKYSHVPFRVEHLDLKKSGLRNTEALVATEASCVVLRHPKTHIKVTAKKAVTAAPSTPASSTPTSSNDE